MIHLTGFVRLNEIYSRDQSIRMHGKELCRFAMLLTRFF